MQKPSQVALLVGSPKGLKSTSNSIGTCLVDKLEQKGVPYTKMCIRHCLRSEQEKADLLRLVAESDLIILAFPLYVDSLPSEVIETLELIAEHQKGNHGLGKKSFVAISNSGFPEAKQNSTALDICQLFAKQVGFNWAGGLGWGGGGMVDGEPLSKLGFRIRSKMKALEITADALAQGEPIPEKAITLMCKLGIPRSLYLLMANRRWKKQAKKNIPIKTMYAQPLIDVLKQTGGE